MKKELIKYQNELAKLPDGYLTKKGTTYYHKNKGMDIGITKNPELIRQLARKKYIHVYKKELENNIARYDGEKCASLSSPSEIISSLSRTYKEFPIEYFFESSIADWIAASFKQNPYLPEQRKYLSNNGMKFRSKSEVFIANQLEKYHLPYRYDAEQKLRGRIIYPDFIIRNPFTGDFIIWEHFGALHLPEYEQKMNKKMREYLQFGYTPFENIIYTFEADTENPKRIKQLIEAIILK